MKKKRKNKGRKSLTAMGAVVAAGLTPGIATGTPAPQSPGPEPSPDVELTAADVVSINGDVFDFDELFAMRQVVNSQHPQKVVYGPPPSREKDTHKNVQQTHKKVYGPPPPRVQKTQQADESEQVPQDSISQEEVLYQQRLREAYREDSIRRAIEARKLVYGPPPPRYLSVGPEELRHIAANDKQEAANMVLEALMDYCAQMPLDPNVTGHIILSENSDLVRELEMGHTQLESLQQEIENRFGIQLTEEMLKQLSTLRRIANFIAEVAAPIKEE